jgi:nucleotide-binding universal stress UspA family protein
METIVIGYDDSEAAKRALERAATLAKLLGSKLVVTSVAPVSTPAAARSMGGADATDTAADHDAQLAAARSYLQTQSLEADYVEALGHPGDAIVATAADRGADLIVVGTRELGTLQRLLGMSVSDSVAHHAHCDVLIVHSH